jgi:transcriptional regulator with XRE-family HTH domain
VINCYIATKGGEFMNERIKQLRKNLNLTQQEFAEKIGSVQNTITGYESGRRNPSDSVINNICKTFNVNEEWLRDGTGNMFLEIDREDQIMEWAGEILKEKNDSFKKRFVAMLSKLSSDEWEVLEKMALSLAEEKETSDDL